MDGRDYLELVAWSEVSPDEHAVCPCGGLMAFDAATGLLRCGDCRTGAIDAATLIGRDQP